MRDFTYTDDIIDGVFTAINSCSDYEIYNLGSSNQIRLDKLIEQIETILDKKAFINYQPLQISDVMQTHANVTKARDNLGYEPKIELYSGLVRFVEWLEKSYKS